MSNLDASSAQESRLEMCMYDGLCYSFGICLDTRAASKYLMSSLKLKFFCSVYLSETQICKISAVDQRLMQWSERIVRVLFFSFSLCAQTSCFAKLQLQNHSIIWIQFLLVMRRLIIPYWYKCPVLKPFFSRWLKILRAFALDRRTKSKDCILFLHFCSVFMLWKVAVG